MTSTFTSGVTRLFLLPAFLDDAARHAVGKRDYIISPRGTLSISVSEQLVRGNQIFEPMPNKSLDASGGSVFRNISDPVVLE